jgi:hypothetical protein
MADLVLPLGVTTGTWLADMLLEDVKRRARVPAGQTTVADWEILRIADNKIRDYLAPLLISVAEDYMTATVDVPIVAGVSVYYPPPRCMKLREILFLDTRGNEIDIPRLRQDGNEQRDWGFRLNGTTLTLVNADRENAAAIRFVYYLRPSSLVKVDAVGVVKAVNAATGVVDVYALPSGVAGGTAFDFVNARAPFDTFAAEVSGTVDAVNMRITFDPAAVPSELSVGDFICLPEQTPAPQLAPELFTLLSQAVVVEILDEQGDESAFERAARKLSKLDEDARIILSSRVEGEPFPIATEDPIWDRTWARGVWRAWR